MCENYGLNGGDVLIQSYTNATPGAPTHYTITHLPTGMYVKSPDSGCHARYKERQNLIKELAEKVRTAKR